MDRKQWRRASYRAMNKHESDRDNPGRWAGG
jgi:hypothetical protein